MKGPTDNPFKDLLLTLVCGRVDFVVAGGVASVLHGVPRVTMDLDISISMDMENIRRFLLTMKESSLIPRAPIPPETLLHPEAREKMVREKGAIVFTFLDSNDPLRQVDVFLTKDLSYPELLKHTEVHEIEGHRIRIVSAEYLLKLKRAIRPPREKDKFDIRVLTKLVGERND